MREEEDTICVEMMRKLWWLTQIYFRMGATPARSMADGAGKTAVGREKKMVAPARREMEVRRRRRRGVITLSLTRSN